VKFKIKAIKENDGKDSFVPDGDNTLDGNLGNLITSEEFMRVPCWLDEWDENLVTVHDELEKNTVYRTGYTKGFLYWMNSLDDDFNLERYLDGLRRVVNNGKNVTLYMDYYTADCKNMKKF